MQTPDADGNTPVVPRALLAETNPPPTPIDSPPSPKPPKPKEALPARFSVGTIEIRTPEEEVRFQHCEAVIAQGWGTFAAVGAALAEIKGKRLYKNEYTSFEDYAWERWGFGSSHLWRYLAAADVRKVLDGVPGLPMPECEAQTRPLTGLSPELALQAWLQTLEWARDGPVTARLVKRAVRRVLKAEPAAVAASNAEKQRRSWVRQSVRAGFKELLTLVMGSADRDSVIAKIAEIERLLEPFLSPKKRVGKILPQN